MFIALMLFLGKRVIPAALSAIAGTESRELFVLVALTLAVGTALASAEVFGVSLALGAFVAGIVVAESPYATKSARIFFLSAKRSRCCFSCPSACW